MGLTAEERQTILQGVIDGKSVSEVCRAGKISRYWFYQDLLADADFANNYARADAMRADAEFDKMLAIADTPEIGEKRKINADGTIETTEGDMIEHRRLQIETRKWVLGKMNARKYGDKLAVGGADDLPPIKHDTTDIARRIAFALASGVEAENGDAASTTE